MEWENFDEASPFQGMKISLHQALRDLPGRYTCQTCQKSLRYFCYHCLQLNPLLERPRRSIPTIILPPSLPLTVIQDVRETPGKSTAMHAKLLAPTQVDLISVDLKSSLDLSLEDDSIVLFPSKDAKIIADIDWKTVKRLVVIDGTWQQARAIMKCPALSAAPCVKLDGKHQTHFWRYQHLSTNCLSTIEAIYHFYQEYNAITRGQLDPQLDNLLYFFSFQYELIQQDYQNNPTRKFTSKHRKNYIQINREPL